MGSDKIKGAALKYAVYNAASHGGEAQMGPVIGRILGELPHLRERAKEVTAIVGEVVGDVNSWSPERQRQVLEERWPELLEKRKRVEEKKRLPPLQNVDRFREVRTRFAPNPDGPLHLGSAEPIIFCDEYAKMYDGKFILRFEDTSPDVKAPIEEMYTWIQEDLDWLGVKVDELYIQSDRLEIYYGYAKRLIKKGSAYVCTCEPAAFKELYMAKEACPCRDLPPEVHLERWKMMLNGPYMKGDAVVRIKTDLDHPNPALRDWPALRITSGPHPRQGSKYRVWPLYNFSCSVDDHEMEVSHIIRGKEHEVNTERQRYIYRHMGWEYPEIINIGRLGLEVGVLSKSVIRRGLEDGIYESWDDPRLGTLKALRRRGLQPETIRGIMIQVGPKPINAALSWAQIASINRRNIEEKANRYYFVDDPALLAISGVDEEHLANLPLHPDHADRGTRTLRVVSYNGQAVVNISKSDAAELRPSSIVRLMGLFNVEIVGTDPLRGRLHSLDRQEARGAGAPFIHWLPADTGIKAEVVMPDASVVKGLAGQGCAGLKVDDIIQFERFGFVRVDRIEPFKAYFTHR
ncbi:MAG: glutamate--tRNA ligase [Candidatus Bathyarchaeota archaeon]|nr:MAG: glutamate--tRNA ligase [Candidatus Bathyarchaeota archaeon]